MTESRAPEKKTKPELEQLVKANGGKIYQTNKAAADTLCIAERSELHLTRIYRKWANTWQGRSKLLHYRKMDSKILFDHRGLLTASSRM
jgi:hypothetical protein